MPLTRRRKALGHRSLQAEASSWTRGVSLPLHLWLPAVEWFSPASDRFIQAGFTPISRFYLVPRSTWRSLEALLFIQFLTVCCADSWRHCRVWNLGSWSSSPISFLCLDDVNSGDHLCAAVSSDCAQSQSLHTRLRFSCSSSDSTQLMCLLRQRKGFWRWWLYY